VTDETLPGGHCSRQQRRPVIDMVGYVSRLKKDLQCNCDLDNWEPERETGHSWVCRIHKAAMRKKADES